MRSMWGFVFGCNGSWLALHLEFTIQNDGFKGQFVFSGFSGDPLMGSHTIPLTENQYQPLLDYCLQKCRDLNAREESLFSEIIDQSVLQQEMGKSTEPFAGMPLSLSFDSWYFVNRNRYTTQMGVMSNRDKFEYILPFLRCRAFLIS